MLDDKSACRPSVWVMGRGVCRVFPRLGGVKSLTSDHAASYSKAWV